MRYYIIAGEASGDLHGSNLMKGLYQEDSSAQIRFWGGDLMDEVYRACASEDGGGLVHHYREGAVMGITDVMAKAGRLLANLRSCKEDILAWKPDAVILIDYPGFNMKIAKFAHEAGIKVFYYIAPKTWASREGRNRKLRSYVDRLFIVFPFEIPYFESRNIPFTYRGNPLLDAVDNSPAMSESRASFLERNALEDRPSIAILAGSRKAEVSRTLPVAIEVADRMHALAEYSGYDFLVAGAPSRSEEDYRAIIGNRDYVRLVFGETYGVVRHSRAAIINSGTASLEAALIGTPQVVVWSTTPFTAFIARKVLRVLDHVKFISLGNLIADKLVFRELIQEDFTAEMVCAEIRRIMEDASYRNEMLSGYAQIRDALGGKGSSGAVARAMIEELNR
ncbi:MAG: lipid-A-disaccharide synthase [Bacteroidales bacterium]|nr:lipid-A-disaccharide synthase [Bacteroidales bacterium]